MRCSGDSRRLWAAFCGEILAGPALTSGMIVTLLPRLPPFPHSPIPLFPHLIIHRSPVHKHLPSIDLILDVCLSSQDAPSTSGYDAVISRLVQGQGLVRHGEQSLEARGRCGITACCGCYKQ